MNKDLLEYLRDMALEMAALAEEGDLKSLALIFGMAALDADQRIGPRANGNHREAEPHVSPSPVFLPANDDLGRGALKPEPAN
jgi:hypothetical protein